MNQLYEELKKDLILQTPEHEVTAANAASLSNKLSQLANGAIYTDDKQVIADSDYLVLPGVGIRIADGFPWKPFWTMQRM